MSPLISDIHKGFAQYLIRGRDGAAKYMEEGEHPQTWLLATLVTAICPTLHCLREVLSSHPQTQPKFELSQFLFQHKLKGN